jgi:hypothetical protein
MDLAVGIELDVNNAWDEMNKILTVGKIGLALEKGCGISSMSVLLLGLKATGRTNNEMASRKVAETQRKSIDAINRISFDVHTEAQRTQRNGFNRDGQDIE